MSEGATDTAPSQRVLGLPAAVSLVVGSMIGSGVFLLPASLARFGGVALLGWIVSALGATVLAVVFARLSRIDPAAGGPYAYTRHAFGDLAGFLIAWGYWISIWTADAALSVAFVGYLSPFIPTIVAQPPLAAALAVATVWVLTIVNIRGVRTAGRVQVVTTVLKLLPLVAIAICGVLFFDARHFAIADTSPRAVGQGLIATTTLTMFALIGLEAATVPATVVKDPDRTIPRATVIGTLIAAGIYILSTIGVMSLVEPASLMRSTAPFADAARAVMGDRAAALVALGASISCFGALNGWILIVGQLPVALVADGLWPSAFGRMSRRGTPAFGMVVAAVLTTALIAMNYSKSLVDLFTFIILLATLAVLIPYAFCALAGLLILGRRGERPSAREVTLALIAFVFSFAAIIGAGANTVFWGFMLLLAGLPVYVWVVRERVRGGRS
ncbi:MAG TPA: amino acid permease [Vicinamibacterales bacterium]|nr:amino acid permease [Vicinamibacterales bacterium]